MNRKKTERWTRLGRKMCIHSLDCNKRKLSKNLNCKGKSTLATKMLHSIAKVRYAASYKFCRKRSTQIVWSVSHKHCEKFSKLQIGHGSRLVFRPNVPIKYDLVLLIKSRSKNTKSSFDRSAKELSVFFAKMMGALRWVPLFENEVLEINWNWVETGEKKLAAFKR